MHRDLCKVEIQGRHSSSVMENENENENNKQNAILSFLYKKIDIVHFAIEIIKRDGASSLYNGMTSSIFGSVLQNGIYFCTSKIFGYMFEHHDIKLGPLANSMLINLLAATCTAIVTNPIWVLNTRMARKKGQVNNVMK